MVNIENIRKILTTYKYKNLSLEETISRIAKEYGKASTSDRELQKSAEILCNYSSSSISLDECTEQLEDIFEFLNFGFNSGLDFGIDLSVSPSYQQQSSVSSICYIPSSSSELSEILKEVRTSNLLDPNSHFKLQFNKQNLNKSKYLYALVGSRSGLLSSNHSELVIEIRPSYKSSTLDQNTKEFFAKQITDKIQEIINFSTTSIAMDPDNYRKKFKCLPIVKLISGTHSGSLMIQEILV